MASRHIADGAPRAGTTLGLALLSYALTVGASMLPTRGAPTRTDCLASAGIVAAGSVLMAWILARRFHPARQTFLAAAAVLALFMLLTPFTAGRPDAWRDHVRPLVWLAPWFQLATATTTGGRRVHAGAAPCRRSAHAATPLLMLEAMVLGAIMLAIGPVSRLLTGAR